jgi:lipoprotein-releasing system permease protein
MGFDSGDIVIIFLLQSVVIGLFGGVLGTTLGLTISVIVDNSAFPVATLETYPIAYEASNYVMAFVSGLLTTFIAGFLPARKASRVDPVDILRGT